MTLTGPFSARLRQRTWQPYGHFLNHRQVFSPDGLRAFYDTRNADPEIMVTSRIESIDLESGQSRVEYAVPSASGYGPGVGAVVVHPQRSRLLFIHGLWNCTADNPYSVTRRFGALIDGTDVPIDYSNDHSLERKPVPFEGRWIAEGCPRGCLRGGTHAHGWSRDGQCASFTYNDHVMEVRHRQGLGPPDLRTVGVVMFGDSGMGPEGLSHPAEPNPDMENFSGAGWACVVAKVVENPKWGSDEIESAREECWVEGRPWRTLAFLGRVRSLDGQAIDEVFVAELRGIEPTMDRFNLRVDLRESAPVDVSGRLMPPSRSEVRRVTYSQHRRFPGVSGPRNWLVASPDGQRVYFPMQDDQGIVQIARVELDSGRIEPISELRTSLENQIAIDSSGEWLTAICDGMPGLVSAHGGPWRPLLNGPSLTAVLSGAVHFLPDGSGWLIHGYPKIPNSQWLQLWTITLH